MRINFTVAALGLIFLGGAVAAGYVAGTAQQGPPAAAAPKAAAHPPLAQAQPEGPGPTQGRAGFQPGSQANFTHFRVGNKNVKRLLVDGSRIWVATSGGLIRYEPGKDEYKLYDNRSGLLSNGIFHVGKLGGRIVVGTYGGGMSILDEPSGRWETYNVPEGLGDAFVYDVLQAKNGDVWVATWSGANRIRGGTLKDRKKWDLYTVENTKGGLPNDWVYGLAEGRNGEIWMATEGGMARFAEGRWTNWNHAKGLGAPYEKVKHAIEFKSDPARQSSHHAKQKEEMGLKDVEVAYNPNYVVALAVEPSGIVWAGTWGGGLARYDGKSWRNFTTADGLPGNHVFMLHRDSAGKLWIGTNAGLARYENGKFPAMTTQDGLFANAVFSMASAEGALWVGSYGGVAQLRGKR